MKKLYILFLFAAGFIACDPDDPEFQSVDQSQITKFHNEISGPGEAFASGKSSNIYKFSAMPRSGSTYKWSVEGNSGAVINPDPDYPFLAEIVFGQSETTNPDAKVVLTETTKWGATNTFEHPLTLNAFCPYDLTKFQGTYIESVGGDAGSIEITTDPDDQLFGLKITDVLASWCGDEGSYIFLKFNACTNALTFPKGAETTQTINGIDALCGYDGPRLVQVGSGEFNPSTGILEFRATVRVNAGSFGTFNFTYVPE